MSNKPTNGKGSDPRPLSVSLKEFSNNWDLAFGRKKKPQKLPDDPTTGQINDNEPESLVIKN